MQNACLRRVFCLRVELILAMKTVYLQKYNHAYIFAPQALTGTELALRQNLLIKVSAGKIAVMEQVNPEALPAALKKHPRFYRLEEGLTLLPCLIDAHVHLALNGRAAAKGPIPPGAAKIDLPQGIVQNLAALLQQGVGAVRDGGDRLALNVKAAKMIEAQSLPGPRIVATGEALRKAGSYGSFLGRGFNGLSRRLESLASEETGQVKVIVSGIVSFSTYGMVEPLSSFSLAELRAVVEHAHRCGKMVMAHASSSQAVELALRAGVDSIEHGYFLSERQLKEMAARGIAWVPTIIPVAVQARQPLCRQWNDAEIDVITRTFREQVEKVACAAALGVPLGLGTDSGAAGVDHGTAVLEEMQLYAEAGLPFQAILQAATAVNAAILGLSHCCGSLELNKEARLMAVRGNPLTDLKALQKIEWLFS